jgi:antitoxin (DNA-binding transcriptional repressor) of toxin-antitoxin stability system
MKKLNIHDAKTHLSEHLAGLCHGETIILCRRNRPIAEIRSLQEEETAPRPLGLASDVFQVPAEFFAPLPDDVLSSFQDISS